jgi:uncharacterized protein YcfJ
MKKILSVAVVAALGLGSSVAMAKNYGDVARVVSSTPVLERVAVPSQQCWTQPVTTYETRRVTAPAQYETVARPNAAGAVVGAVLGGVIGHQFGNSSRGRDHATAAGAVVGGLLGSQAGGPSYQTVAVQPTYLERVPVTQNVQQCRTVTHYQDRVIGYDVRYKYHGREYITRMAQAPGRTIVVDVAMRVRPVGTVAVVRGPGIPRY